MLPPNGVAGRNAHEAADGLTAVQLSSATPAADPVPANGIGAQLEGGLLRGKR